MDWAWDSGWYTIRNVLGEGVMLNKNLLAQICNESLELLVKKNADYGSSYFDLRREFGKVAFLIRLSDKVSRLKNLAKKEATEINETEEDTIKDIIGYCILELYYRRSKPEK